MSYFFPNDDCLDEFFGSGDYFCVTEDNLQEMSKILGISLDDLMKEVHPAADWELAYYGKGEHV